MGLNAFLASKQFEEVTRNEEMEGRNAEESNVKKVSMIHIINSRENDKRLFMFKM